MSPQEKRRTRRYPFHWPVIVVPDGGQSSYRAGTHEISIHGCSVLTDENLKLTRPARLFIALPPETAGAPRTVVAIEARLVYTVLSASQGKFRSGFEFIDFKEDGRGILKHAIDVRAISSVGRDAD